MTQPTLRINHAEDELIIRYQNKYQIADNSAFCVQERGNVSLFTAHRKMKGYIAQKHLFKKQRINQRINGPVNAHLISWPSKAQDIQNLENIW